MPRWTGEPCAAFSVRWTIDDRAVAWWPGLPGLRCDRHEEGCRGIGDAGAAEPGGEPIRWRRERQTPHADQARLLRHRFGRRSEQLGADQLQFGLEDLEQTAAANQAGQEAADIAAGGQRRRSDARPNRNHGALPAHLPRYEVVIDIEDRACPCCGGSLQVMGELRTEQLDIAPAQLRVRVTRRPRYVCNSCDDVPVVVPAPERPIDGGMATEALIVHVVVSKFCDGLPLYRQSQMLARQGVTLDRSTLSNWVGRACWWLTPLYELIVGTVLAATKLFADDTTLPVLDPGRGRTKKGRLWCYAVDDRPWRGESHPVAAYVYSEDHRVAHPAEHLASFKGVLQGDGYNGFKRLAGDRADASVCCMRRGFAISMKCARSCAL
jgi:transposase